MLDSADGPGAVEAERLGLWAVMVTGPSGTEAVRAARVAVATSHIRIVVAFAPNSEPPFTIAEEISVLDNLSAGRITAIVDAGLVDGVREALSGRPQRGGAVVTPPSVQTSPTVWTAPARSPDAVPTVGAGVTTPGSTTLSGDTGEDAHTIDRWRDAGCTHLLVVWPGDLLVLARHLATRAVGPAFPAIVAEMAERLDR